LHGHVGEAQTACSLPIHFDRSIDPLECIFANGSCSQSGIVVCE
jgi:hypothetical protein